HGNIEAEVYEDEPQEDGHLPSIGEQAFPSDAHGPRGARLELTSRKQQKKRPGHEGRRDCQYGCGLKTPCGNEKGDDGRTSGESEVAAGAEYCHSHLGMASAQGRRDGGALGMECSGSQAAEKECGEKDRVGGYDADTAHE